MRTLVVKRSIRSNDDTAVTLQKCWLLCLTCYVVFEVNSSDAISVSIGGHVELPCTVEVGGNVQVIWMSPSNDTLTFNENTQTSDSRFKVLRPYQKEWTLRLDSVRGTDAGTYTCRIRILSQEQTKQIELVVKIPPSIQVGPDKIEIASGEDLVLQCTCVAGIPQPTITWYFSRDGKSYQELSSNETILLSSVTSSNAGKYECVAINGVSPNANKGVEVDVLFKPEISVPYRQIMQQFGTFIVLECRLNSNPLGEVKWEMNGKEIIHSKETKFENRKDEKYVSYESSVDKYEKLVGLFVFEFGAPDCAEYRCSATNQYGSAEGYIKVAAWRTDNLEVKLFPRDTSVTDGEDVMIHCSIEGTSSDAGDALVWWKYDQMSGEYVKLYGSSSQSTIEDDRYEIFGTYNLQIKRARVSDEGTYLCEVVGHWNYTARLTVIAQSSSVDCGSLTSQTQLSTVGAICGSILIVICIVFGIVIYIVVNNYRRKKQQLSSRYYTK